MMNPEEIIEVAWCRLRKDKVLWRHLKTCGAARIPADLPVISILPDNTSPTDEPISFVEFRMISDTVAGRSVTATFGNLKVNLT